VLVGHSDGASIALIHAGGAGDERVKGLILAAPHVFVEDLTLAGIRAAAKAFERGGLRERLVRYHGGNVDCAFHGWSDAWLDPRFRSWNIEEFLSGIEVPTLLIQGEDDNYGTALQLEAIVRQVPAEVTRLLLPDCGHSPHRDQPEPTLRAVADFVERLRGRMAADR
jgi:pimeloyl-ACP methyl ester carboxylesterase